MEDAKIKSNTSNVWLQIEYHCENVMDSTESKSKICGMPACSGCKYWKWIDEDMCPHSVEIISRLLRRINQMEKQLKNAEESAQKWECKAAKLQTKVRKLEIMVQRHASKEMKLAAALAITYSFVLAGFAVWVIGNLGNNDLLQLPKKDVL